MATSSSAPLVGSASPPAKAAKSSLGLDVDKVRYQWAFKVLGLPDTGVSKREELEGLRVKSKELYKQKAKEKKTAEAKKVLEAFEVVKTAFLKREERRKEAKRAAASGNSKAVGPVAGPARPKESDKEKPQDSKPSDASSNGKAVAVSAAAPASKDAAAAQAQRKRYGVGSSSASSSKEAPALKKALQTKMSRSDSVLICASCGQSTSLKRPPQLGAGIFSCPGCRVRAMDPFNPPLEKERGMLKLKIIQPPLVPETAHQEATFEIPINIPNLQKWRKQGEEIDVRMINLDTCDPYQAWPHSLTCYINDRPAFTIDPPKEGHKRRDVPRRISASLKSGVNKLKVHCKDGFSVQRYVFALVRVKPRAPRELMKVIRLVSEEECKEKVSGLLFSSQLESTGEEVEAAGSDRSSLICPVTLGRIDTPVRGHKCRHLQCFDLKAYLVSNLRMSAFNKRWSCPVCALVVYPPQDLFIDTYMLQILGQTEADDAEVCFDSVTAEFKVSAKLSPPPSPSSDMEEEPPEAADGEDEGDKMDQDAGVACASPDPGQDPEVACASPAASPPPDDLEGDVVANDASPGQGDSSPLASMPSKASLASPSVEGDDPALVDAKSPEIVAAAASPSASPNAEASPPPATPASPQAEKENGKAPPPVFASSVVTMMAPTRFQKSTKIPPKVVPTPPPIATPAAATDIPATKDTEAEEGADEGTDAAPQSKQGAKAKLTFSSSKSKTKSNASIDISAVADNDYFFDSDAEGDAKKENGAAAGDKAKKDEKEESSSSEDIDAKRWKKKEKEKKEKKGKAKKRKRETSESSESESDSRSRSRSRRRRRIVRGRGGQRYESESESVESQSDSRSRSRDRRRRRR